MSELIKDHDPVCPVCKGQKVCKIGDGDGESVRKHTCLRCYGTGINKLPAPPKKRRLYLHVKRCYFLDVKEGRKPFEFRLDNDYWRKKLEGVDYDEIVYMAGYPPAGDTENTMILPYHGYEKQNITHEHFGNKPENVFAIRMTGDAA